MYQLHHTVTCGCYGNHVGTHTYARMRLTRARVYARITRARVHEPTCMSMSVDVRYAGWHSPCIYPSQPDGPPPGRLQKKWGTREGKPDPGV